MSSIITKKEIFEAIEKIKSNDRTGAYYCPLCEEYRMRIGFDASCGNCNVLMDLSTYYEAVILKEMKKNE